MWKFIPKWILLSIALTAVIGFAIGYIWKSNELVYRLMREEIFRLRRRTSKVWLRAKADSIIAGEWPDRETEIDYIIQDLHRATIDARITLTLDDQRVKQLNDRQNKIRELFGRSPRPLWFPRLPGLPDTSDLYLDRDPGLPDPNLFEVPKKSRGKTR